MAVVKKSIVFSLLLAVFLCMASAFALTAPNIALALTDVAASKPLKSDKYAFDGDVNTAVVANSGTVVAQDRQKLFALSVQWRAMPGYYTVHTAGADGVFTKFANGEAQLLRQVFRFDKGVAAVKLQASEDTPLSFCNLQAWGEGDLPGDLQDWKPTVQNADLMVIAAHPDDDMLFMGGTIPYYAGEKGKNVVVVYMSHQKRIRQSEAMDALWLCKNQTAPVFVGYPDRYSEDVKTAAQKWGGEEKVTASLVELIRKYQPEVIVTHDVGGEYGHGAHRLVAKTIQDAVRRSADPQDFSASFAQYGAFAPQKLYLHMFQQGKITMDWRKPLAAFDGKTAFDMAVLGYDQHKSQHIYSFAVRDTGRTGCAQFGLAFSTVGEDVKKDDFFENIG